MLVAVGTTNAAKLSAVQQALPQVFPDIAPESIQVRGVNVPSGVSNQPMSDAETLQGARNRAQHALEAVPGAQFGIEGGVNPVADKWFDCGFVVVVDTKGKQGTGTSGRYELSQKIVKRLQGGEELAEVIDDLAGTTDNRSRAGAMGDYIHGIYFAFAPWMSDAVYWD
ncbi:hypothetical protein HDV05_008106 [Chytridiales sp. JEL 0842]|nr:hypothetical protein HDV05_008106 [Chytridiales sp. JEL 0842]